MNTRFWNGKRVFVTGHTGFMGGWLCERLLALGAEVNGYALPAPTQPSLFEAIGLWNRMPGVTADVRDSDRLTATVRAARPEIVFHLAAQPLVRRAHAIPAETFSINVMGTVNVLEAVRRTPSVAAAVLVTTDKVYENREWSWGYRENDRLGGHEPYGASKACAEHVVEAYARSYFDDPSAPGIATVRAGNIVGGGDWAEDRLVPDAIRAFARGRRLEIRHPDAVRPWQHVLDPVCGMTTLAERLTAAPRRFGGGWNLGPAEGDTHTVAWLADRLVSAWGRRATWTAKPDSGPHEATTLKLTSARAKADLGWQPRWDAETALNRAVEWYRAFYDGTDMAPITRSQINAHEKGDESGEFHRTETAGRGRAVA